MDKSVQNASAQLAPIVVEKLPSKLQVKEGDSVELMVAVQGKPRTFTLVWK